MFVTVINHKHRQEVDLTTEEYIIAKEAWEKRAVNPMDRADLIVEKCGYTLDRVIITLSRLYCYKLMSEGDNGLEASEKWTKNYYEYYPAVNLNGC
jgi:hypothetical protein